MIQINSFTKIAKDEWRVWLVLAVSSFVVASLFMSGWPKGLAPEIHTPFTYAGDGFAYLWNIQRVIEGAWYFENARAGFPFGSNHLDYPTADTGSYLITKFFGLLFQSAVAAANLYFLIGFALCAAITYLITRAVGLAKPNAIACAFIYAFATFHFARIGHLFFSAYFVAPLFFYLGFRLIAGRMILSSLSTPWSQKLWNSLGIFCMTSFGIYYDLFGCIVIVLCTLMAYGLHRSWRHVFEGVLTLGVVVLGLLLNILPSLMYLMANGESREGINRLAYETELYGLRVTQMLLPHAEHRFDSFAEFASRYNNHFPFITENMSASMGSVASIGFILLILALLIVPFMLCANEREYVSQEIAKSEKIQELRLKLLIAAILAIGLVTMANIGGGSSLFALIVSPSFRSWNRISIFIVFLSLLGLFFAIQISTVKLKPTRSLKFLHFTIAIALTTIALYDQTVRPCHSCLISNQTLVNNDHAFFQTLEVSLPKQAAVYQLPYMTYPESSPVNNLGSYDQARGHLHTTALRWSFGGARGRVGDWFFRKLSSLPIDQQVVVATSMGFAGIYIDKRGYLTTPSDARCAALPNTKMDRLQNNCLTIAEVEQDIAIAIGENFANSSLLSQDKQLVFFPLNTTLRHQAQQISLANSYLLPIGFKLEDGFPVQLEGGFESALDLRQEDSHFPAYIGGVSGLSSITVINGQNVGRWSDAHTAKHITIWFSKPLPPSFNLEIRAQAAGPNAGKPVKVKVGKQIKEVMFGAEFSSQTLAFETSERAQKIELFPAEPFSPARQWGAADKRVLAIQLEQLSIK